jgi:hypothetical protein
MSLTDTFGSARAFTAGVDWAKDNHAVCVLDAGGTAERGAARRDRGAR